jgi:hypothetical protein
MPSRRSADRMSSCGRSSRSLGSAVQWNNRTLSTAANVAQEASLETSLRHESGGAGDGRAKTFRFRASTPKLTVACDPMGLKCNRFTVRCRPKTESTGKSGRTTLKKRSERKSDSVRRRIAEHGSLTRRVVKTIPRLRTDVTLVYKGDVGRVDRARERSTRKRPAFGFAFAARHERRPRQENLLTAHERHGRRRSTARPPYWNGRCRLPTEVQGPGSENRRSEDNP